LFNLRAAWQAALADLQLDWLTQGLHMLRAFYNIQSRFQEGAEWLVDTAVVLTKHADQTPDPSHPVHQLLGKVLTRRASFCAWLGHRAEAETLFQRALPLTRRFQDLVETGFLLLNLGYHTVVTGDYEAAGQQFQESLDSYRRVEDARGIADALSAVGALHNMTGDWVKARQYLEESVAISRQLQDEDRLRSSLTNLGNVHYLTGNHAQAKQFYEEVLPLCQKVGDRMSEAIIASNLGTLAQEAGDYQTAVQQLQRGLHLFQEAQHLPAVIQCSTNLAAVYREMGQLGRAQQTLIEALAQAINHQYDYLIPLVVYETGLLYLALGQRERALALLLWMSQHPSAQAENRLKAEALLAEAWTQMSPERVTAVQQTSQTVTPETVLTSLTNLILPTRETNPVAAATLPMPSLAATAPPANTERFTFQGLIARGGMGELYRARDNQTGQIVAVKRLLPHLIAPDSETLSPEAIARFQREAEVLQRLNHPNIVQIITTLEAAGQMMIVMEYLPGGSLRDRLVTGELLSLLQVVDIALELADALARAHHLHIIHRDLKPENVLLAADGTPRLSDFGIAGLGESGSHLTQQGTTLGTFAYMSPEACRGEQLTAQTDIWSFGVMLYEMLAGRNPFEKGYVAATVTAVLHDTPPFILDIRPDTPLTLSSLLDQMLVKEPQARLSTVRQAAAALEQIRSQIG
jgi:tetratricopeptide (TPR) repeat protein